MTKATDTGKWEEMVLKGAQFLIEHSGGTWGSTPPHHKDWALAESEGTLQAAGVKELVEGLSEAVGMLRMVSIQADDSPDTDGQQSWDSATARLAALSDNGEG